MTVKFESCEKMPRFPVAEEGSRSRFYHDGFLYRRICRRGDGCLYFKCVQGGCQGRATFDDLDGLCVHTHAHNHEGDLLLLDVMDLKRAVINRCRESEDRPFRVVFDEECERLVNSVFWLAVFVQICIYFTFAALIMFQVSSRSCCTCNVFSDEIVHAQRQNVNLATCLKQLIFKCTHCLQC